MATKITYPDKVTGDQLTASEFDQIKPAVNVTIDEVANHVVDTDNPHETTKAQVGLSNVDNTSDDSKPVSTAQATAIGLKADKTTTVNGHALSGNISVTKADVGLSNVDNTSDTAKPVSTAQQTALDLKVDKVAGKVLSDNNYTTAEKIKLAGLAPLSTPFLASKTYYGCKGDAIVCLNAATVAGSNIVVVADGNFSNADIGKSVGIPYAGADNGTQTIGQTLLATITGVTNATTIVISVNAVKTIVASRTITDGVMAIDSNVLTSATANFTASDVGKKIIIPGAGELTSTAGVAPKTTWISAVTNSTTITVTSFALQAVTAQTINIPGGYIQYGTDDTAALQNAITDSAQAGAILLLENGRYHLLSSLNPANNLSIRGQTRLKATLAPMGFGFSCIGAVGVTGYSDVKFDSFEMDGYGVTVNTYATINKGIYVTDLLRPIFREVYIHDFSATGVGCDFLRNYVMDNVNASHNGRQAFEFGGGAGGSGIGIGTGKYATEAGTIINCFANDNGKQGIFTEAQSGTILSKGVKIISNTANRNGNAGISDRGLDGTIIAMNSCCNNTVCGIDINLGFVAGTYSINTNINNNFLKGNLVNGIFGNIKNGSITINDNEIDGEITRSNSGAIALVMVASGTPLMLTIERNLLNANKRRGIYLSGSAYNLVSISTNKIFNTGTAIGGTIPAIDVQSAVTKLYTTNNIATDTRAVGSKTQGIGMTIGAVTITKFIFDGNDFDDNATSNTNFTSATITTQITHFNP